MRVLLVDDSAVVRGAVGRVIDGSPECTVASTAANGRQAVAAVRQLKPDVVVLDLEMPEMDGMTALPLIREAHPDVRVLILSAHGSRGADVTLRALALGAADFVCKVASPADAATGNRAAAVERYSRELIEKIVSLGRAAQRVGHPRTATSTPLFTPVVGAAPAPRPTPRTLRAIDPRPPLGDEPAVIAIAASTGGPAALTELLHRIPFSVTAPILITQHMPPEFTRRLADRLGVAAGRPCAEAVDGEPILPGRIYVAPGDHHLTVVRDDRTVRVRLTQDAPVHHCRPAADPMFRTVAQAHGTRVLAIVLTGMGADGRDGALEIARGGGVVIAQDEASSVVWGMPGAVVQAGAATQVLPLDRIATEVARLAGPRLALPATPGAGIPREVPA
ncbi:MAG: chemotaxis response regulator protein-glutamate methylesterase [Gemmatimonadaceae bacterium]|nr:chemotaxis response regulator protein-glutamate methylesterase [Gemmatimonadaceae bacterium]